MMPAHIETDVDRGFMWTYKDGLAALNTGIPTFLFPDQDPSPSDAVLLCKLSDFLIGEADPRLGATTRLIADLSQIGPTENAVFHPTC